MERKARKRKEAGRKGKGREGRLYQNNAKQAKKATEVGYLRITLIGQEFSPTSSEGARHKHLHGNTAQEKNDDEKRNEKWIQRVKEKVLPAANVEKLLFIGRTKYACY